MFEIKGKVALVTGGTRGIGLQIARDLAAAGAKVAINGRTMTDEARHLIDETGSDAVAFIEGDVSDPETARSVVQETERSLGGLEILIHAAGGPEPGRMPDLAASDWMKAFDIHVHAVFHLFQAAYQSLAKNGGSVLLMSSAAGLRGCPGTVAYQTVKGAIIPMTRALAMDHGADGIRVNALAPGIIRTRFHENMTEEAKTHNINNRIPVRREGSVEDVATMALELIRNPFMTGETIAIDGGMSMRMTG